MTKIWVRKPAQNDFPLVLNSWLQSYRKAGFNFYLPYEQYKAQQLKIISKILKDPVTTRIACLSDDPDFILGWACWQSFEIGASKIDAVHYAYTKHDYRQQNIAKLLLKKANCIVPGNEGDRPVKKIYCSHATPAYTRLFQKGYRCIYVPEIIEGDTSNIIL